MQTNHYNQTKYSKCSVKAIAAFTLIELMLVILVVALMTLYAVQVINRSMIGSQINRAANQITSIEQATAAYYYTKSPYQWPLPLTTLTSGTAFLPTSALCSPFLAKSSGGSCGQYAMYTGSQPTNANYYLLNLTLPSKALAQQLAAAVPNAWVTSQSTLNVAVLPPTDISLQKNQGWIVSAGAMQTYNYGGGLFTNGTNDSLPTDTASQIYLPKCPSGYEGHIFFIPQRYQTSTNGSIYDTHIAQMTSNNSANDNSITNNSSQSVVYWLPNIDSRGNQEAALSIGDNPDTLLGTNSGFHMAYYMTFCLPLRHWQTNYTNFNSQQDGQCTQSWQDYNGSSIKPCSVDASGANLDPGPVGSADAY